MEIKQIERVLLFSEPTPLQYSEITEKHNVVLVTFAEVAEQLAEKAIDVKRDF